MHSFRNLGMFRDATLASFCTSWNAPKELHVTPAESFDSIDTCESSQVAWGSSNCCDVTSTASPEVKGAVDLLSLKQATWVPDCALYRHRDSASLAATPSLICSTQACDQAASSPEAISSSSQIPSMNPGTPTRSEAARSDGGNIQFDDDPTAKRVYRSLRFHPPASQSKRLPASASPRHSPSMHTVKSPRLQAAITKPTHKGTSRSKDPTSIKEWAALTTWLRMNLHQARTAKRQVCFVGQQQNSRWGFELNPRLSWEEVSKETKHRLRFLPKEAELAFTHKYPHKDPEAWKEKLVKYKPDGSGDGFDIALGCLVYDLHKVYLTHEVHSRRSCVNVGQ